MGAPTRPKHIVLAWQNDSMRNSPRPMTVDFHAVSFCPETRDVLTFARDELRTQLEDPRVFLWVDVEASNVRALNDVLAEIGIDLSLANHFDTPEILPRVVERQDALAFQLYEIESPERHLETACGISEMQLARLIVVLGTDFIVTYHREALDVIDYVKASCADNFRLAGKSPGFIAFLIVERCVYECALLNLANDNALELLEARLTSDADSLKTSGTPVVATNIRTLKKLASCLHIVLMALGTKQSRFVTREAKETFQTLLQSALAVRAAVDSSHHLLEGIVNGMHAREAARTNDIVRILTVMSGVLLPLSLVAGIYGMNFTYVPELRWRWGYFAALGVMTALGLLLYAMFRRAGFVGRPKGRD